MDDDTIDNAIDAIVGMKEADAFEYCRKYGIPVRVVMKNGKARATTDDIQPNRLNLEIVGTKVHSVSVGQA